MSLSSQLLALVLTTKQKQNNQEKHAWTQKYHKLSKLAIVKNTLKNKLNADKMTRA